MKTHSVNHVTFCMSLICLACEDTFYGSCHLLSVFDMFGL